MWLFIQGGGYANLGDQFFNGTEVVNHSGGNIVFVNFNYRVGALGFLASEELRQDGDLNAGLQDQRKMLYWVQEHIAKVSLSLIPTRASCPPNQRKWSLIRRNPPSSAVIQLTW